MSKNGAKCDLRILLILQYRAFLFFERMTIADYFRFVATLCKSSTYALFEKIRKRLREAFNELSICPRFAVISCQICRKCGKRVANSGKALLPAGDLQMYS
jgi:hypothetical protein